MIVDGFDEGGQGRLPSDNGRQTGGRRGGAASTNPFQHGRSSAGGGSCSRLQIQLQPPGRASAPDSAPASIPAFPLQPLLSSLPSKNMSGALPTGSLIFTIENQHFPLKSPLAYTRILRGTPLQNGFQPSPALYGSVCFFEGGVLHGFSAHIFCFFMPGVRFWRPRLDFSSIRRCLKGFVLGPKLY